MYDIAPENLAVLPASFFQREARREALRADGVCAHGTVVTLPESGTALCPEQEGLKPGEVACTERTGGCAVVFATALDWVAVREAQ